MNGHGQRFLAEPPPHGIDVKAGLDQQRAARVTQPMKCQTGLDLAVAPQLGNRLDER